MSNTLQRTVPVSSNGRMNLPASMRHAIGLSGSGRVIVTLVDGEIRITTASQALNRVRELAAPYKPAEGLASDQLIAERRDETEREEAGESGVAPDD